MTSQRFAVWAHRVVPIFICFLMFGCSSKTGPKTEPVSGVVTYNNKPLVNAAVTFHPESPSSGKMAQASTDAEGRYNLQTQRPKDGAVAGKYIVTIVAYDKVDTTAVEIPGGADPEGEMAKRAAAAKPLVPKRYMTAATTPLKETVKSGSNKIDFALTD